MKPIKKKKMPEMGKAMDMVPPKGEGMTTNDGDMVEVSAHKRHKHAQKHPAKPAQPSDMRWIER